MSKYKIQLGSLVTKLMVRNFIVTADNEEDAIAKAERMFYKAAEKHVYTEVGGRINVDSIERIQ